MFLSNKFKVTFFAPDIFFRAVWGVGRFDLFAAFCATPFVESDNEIKAVPPFCHPNGRMLAGKRYFVLSVKLELLLQNPKVFFILCVVDDLFEYIVFYVFYVIWEIF